MSLLPERLVPAFESTLQRATLSGQRTATSVGRAEDGTARFSNEDVLWYLDIAAVYVACWTRAEDVPDLWSSRLGATATTQGQEYYQPDGELRLRGVTPNVNGVRAFRRTLGSHDDFSDRGAGSTDEEPNWIFEGAHYQLLGDTQFPTGNGESWVKAPATVQNSQANIQLAGDDLSDTSASTLDLSQEHTTTTGYLDDGAGNVYGGIFTDAPNNKFDTDAPDDTGYTLYWFDHACADLPDVLQEPVVEFAASFAFASLKDGETLETTLGAGDEALASRRLPAFDLRQLNE